MIRPIIKKIVSLLFVLFCLTCDVHAGGPVKQQRELLITGCARSGTTFIARVLRKSGLAVGHERDGAFGVVSWSMGIDTTDRCWGPSSGLYQFKHIFHQVRHPLKAIASFHLANQRSWDYVYRHIPQINREDKMIVRCVKYWIYWNLKAEKRAEWTYRVEDIENALPEMGRRLGRDLDPAIAKETSKTVNQRDYPIVITWKILSQTLKPELYLKLIKLAERYGYDVSEGYALKNSG